MSATHSFMGFMGVWFWIILIAILALIVWGFSSGFNRKSDGNPGLSPEETLKQRRTNGEITSEEYHQRLADLRR